MTTDKPYLTLVDPDHIAEYEREFVPLPYYAWDERPPTLDLTQDECATALLLAQGDIPAAAALLKVSVIRFNRFFRRSPALARILSEIQDLVVARAAAEYIRALDAPDDRRREWGASRIMQSRAAMGHPFSPAPASSATSNVTINQTAREIVFSWREPGGSGNLTEVEGGSDDAGGGGDFDQGSS